MSEDIFGEEKSGIDLAFRFINAYKRLLESGISNQKIKEFDKHHDLIDVLMERELDNIYNNYAIKEYVSCFYIELIELIRWVDGNITENDSSEMDILFNNDITKTVNKQKAREV